MSEVVDWPQVLARIGSGIVLAGPRTIRDVADAEQQIGIRLPDALSQLYLVTDGVFVRDGQWHTIWPLDRLVSNVLNPLPPEGGPPREWIAFGDDGTGDPFCAPPEGSPIYHWNLTSQESQKVALRLDEFLVDWMGGSLKV